MKAEDLEKIQTRFEAWRRIDPAMNRVVLFAATNQDTDGNTWTDRGRPEKVVAARMTALAKAATQAVRASEDISPAANETQFTAESLFVPQLQDFDFVIQISPKYSKVAKKKRGDNAKFKNIEMQQVASSAKVSPVQLVRLFAEDLQNVYGDAILWFWDEQSGTSIAGLWNPAVTAQRTFKVKPGWNSVPTFAAKMSGEEKEKEKKRTGVDIQLNKEAVYGEIQRLGGELISKIEVNR
jgi:U3 small nucleolar RNA-associated protein 22